MRKLNLTIIFTILFCSIVPGQSLEINELISVPLFENASVGLSVRETNTNTEVYSFNSEKLMSPASSLKLITTLSGITLLGSEFTYKTRLAYGGTLYNDGTLSGDIMLIGGGDPTLGAFRWDGADAILLMKDMVAEIKREGIKCIDGDIIADGTIYNGQPLPDQWNWNDIGNYYGSATWGLNINENLYHIIFDHKSKQGRIAKVKGIAPPLNDIYIKSEVVVAGAESGDQAYIYGGPFQKEKIVRGTIPLSQTDFEIKGSIPNPPLAAADMLHYRLDRHKIKVGGTYKTGKISSAYKTIATYISPPLKDIITEANHKSINLYCDVLLRTIGTLEKGNGSIKNGLKNINQFLKTKGLNTKEIIQRDGSGLASENKITARFMTQYLSVMKESIGRDVIKYIPQVGKEGTVTNLLSGRKLASKYYLKSGSFEGVLTYSGFVKAKSGKTYSICFMVNNYTSSYGSVKNQVEKILVAIYNSY